MQIYSQKIFAAHSRHNRNPFPQESPILYKISLEKLHKWYLGSGCGGTLPGYLLQFLLRFAVALFINAIILLKNTKKRILGTSVLIRRGDAY